MQPEDRDEDARLGRHMAPCDAGATSVPSSDMQAASSPLARPPRMVLLPCQWPLNLTATATKSAIKNIGLGGRGVPEFGPGRRNRYKRQRDLSRLTRPFESPRGVWVLLRRLPA